MTSHEGDAEPAPRESAGVPPGHVSALHVGVGAAETAIYLAVATLLVAAAGFTLAGTIVDLINGSDSRPIGDTGLFLLDRILLLFIVAELLYTLRVVNFSGQVLVEPFLFIGLIAVVRKVLVLAAEAQGPSRDFLIEIGALAGLALVLALSIYLLRRSAVTP